MLQDWAYIYHSENPNPKRLTLPLCSLRSSVRYLKCGVRWLEKTRVEHPGLHPTGQEV